MRSFNTFYLLVICAIGIAGCKSYGKEYKLDDKHDVYYQGDGLDEATAKKLAEYLKAQDYFQSDRKSTVQITKEKDTFNLNFVVDKSKIDADKESKFMIFGGMISQNVFANSPVTIHLCNDQLESFKDLGYCKPSMEEPKITEPKTVEPKPDEPAPGQNH